MTGMSQSRNLTWVVLTGCTLLALAALAYPIYVIRPFRAQGQTELAAALIVRQWGPAVAALSALIGAIAALIIWLSSRHKISRFLALTAGGATIVSAALTRVNIYEIMFHRIDSPQTIAAAQAKLEPDDMVVAIRFGAHARAYPVRMMGYHHIVNDRLDSIPVVATY